MLKTVNLSLTLANSHILVQLPISFISILQKRWNTNNFNKEEIQAMVLTTIQEMKGGGKRRKPNPDNAASDKDVGNMENFSVKTHLRGQMNELDIVDDICDDVTEFRKMDEE